MALDLRLQQKMSQQLVMTPQLQQAIKLLQLNHLELADVLREEMAENPTLEEPVDSGVDDQFDTSLREEAGVAEGTEATAEARDRRPIDAQPTSPEDAKVAADLKTVVEPPGSTPEPSSKDVEKDIDWEAYLDSYSYSLPASTGKSSSEELPPFEASLTKPTSLQDHLRSQIQLNGFSDSDARIALLLIEEVTDDGYLPEDAASCVVDELDAAPDVVEGVVHELQSFDPPGVCSRNLRECLLTQCQQEHPEAALALTIIDQHLKDVERHNYQAIARNLRVSIEEIGEAIKVITQLEPRPGRAYSDKEPQYITPDIYVQKIGGEWVIVLNEDGLPKLRISNYYKNALAGSGSKARSYIQERLRSAAWLIRSIHMRQRTIYKVMESILKFQADFFERGASYLKPLILKDVADDVGMHESTISRVTTNKYVHTPQGIFELKYFFNSSISCVGADSIASESVREHIKRLIDGEDANHPLSDQAIVEMLKQQQTIDIARRTVAKYREMLRIPSSSKRKKVF